MILSLSLPLYPSLYSYFFRVCDASRKSQHFDLIFRTSCLKMQIHKTSTVFANSWIMTS